MDLQLKEYVSSREFKEALGIKSLVPLSFETLAQGEYHRNYIFTNPDTDERLVLRKNYASQMHLDNQIRYEYEALKLLAGSGRTPIPYYINDKYRILVMNYIEGEKLSYQADLEKGLEALADVHSTRIDKNNHLICPENSIMAILSECEDMFGVYKNSRYSDKDKIAFIQVLMDMAYEKARSMPPDTFELCCINTELNNGNFLVNNERAFVIDWEKPLYGDAAQDLGHMLAPTTTFWKTDIILEDDVIDRAVDKYIECVDGRINLGRFKDRFNIFLPVTCLRGITWCAMAYDEYMNPDRELINEYTFNKLKAYLSQEYLDRIYEFLKNH